MKRNILVLDFDGVLNTGPTDEACINYLQAKRTNEDVAAPARLFNAVNVDTLNKAIRLFDPEIVLSTNWMEKITLEDVVVLFKVNGIENARFCPEMPITPRNHEHRSGQIQRALTAIPEDFNFVILDDIESGFTLKTHPVLCNKVVWCDRDKYGEYMGQGLQPEHLDLIAEHLDF